MSIYDQAYRDAIIRSEQFKSIPRKNLSAPHYVSAHDEYWNSQNRLMIAGQETFGIYTSIASEIDLNQMQRNTTAFDNGMGGEYPAARNFPFWWGFHKVTRALGLTHRGALWTNLLKAQTVDLGETSNSPLVNLAPQAIEELLAWQRPLFEAELRHFSPNQVLAFTGPRMNWIWNRMVPDLTWSDLPDRRSQWIRAGRSERWGLTLIRTYHPTYMLRRKPQLAYLLDDAITQLIVTPVALPASSRHSRQLIPNQVKRWKSRSSSQDGELPAGIGWD